MCPTVSPGMHWKWCLRCAHLSITCCLAGQYMNSKIKKELQPNNITKQTTSSIRRDLTQHRQQAKQALFFGVLLDTPNIISEVTQLTHYTEHKQTTPDCCGQLIPLAGGQETTDIWDKHGGHTYSSAIVALDSTHKSQ